MAERKAEEWSRIASGSEKEGSRYQNRIGAGKGPEQRQQSAFGAKVLLLSMVIVPDDAITYLLPTEQKMSFTRKANNPNSHFS